MHPPKWVFITLPIAAFTALIYIFIAEKNYYAPAYLIYIMSAYSLIIIIAALPKHINKIRQSIKKIIKSHSLAERYFTDFDFRGNISIYRGTVIDFFYVIFRIAAGIRYASVWFISIAAYYFALGVLRARLIVYSRRSKPMQEHRFYCITAWLLLLLNIPMGGVIFLTVQTNSGFSYPGYIIYVSAMYTFYAVSVSAINLIKYRKSSSPVLSVSRVLNFIAAIMSIFSLQTAMISQFSENADDFRKLMNTLTGGFVYGAVIFIAVYMLFHGRALRKKAENS